MHVMYRSEFQVCDERSLATILYLMDVILKASTRDQKMLIAHMNGSLLRGESSWTIFQIRRRVERVVTIAEAYMFAGKVLMKPAFESLDQTGIPADNDVVRLYTNMSDANAVLVEVAGMLRNAVRAVLKNCPLLPEQYREKVPEPVKS